MNEQRKEDMKKEFDTLYASTDCVWGLKADKYLGIALKNVENRGHALDIGCGEGRHSLFLAQKGYAVDAIDISEEAIKKLMQYARVYNVEKSITAIVGDVRKMDVPSKRYDLIVISFVFPFLKHSDIEIILKKAKCALKPKGYIYVSALTTDDPEYQNYSEKQTPIEPRTYYSPGLQCYCYFFEKNELKLYFSDYTLIDYTEAVVELSREPYTHAFCLIFAQKR